MTRENLAAVYLDWCNNFLTIAGFAEYYGLYDQEAADLINIARQCYEIQHPQS